MMTEAHLRAFFAPHRVLVTGGSGVIGQQLLRRLRVLRPAALVSYSRTAQRVPDGVLAVAGDVCDERTLATAATGASIVFHLAGCKRTAAGESGARANVEGTAALLRVCEPTRPLVVFTSTAYVYAAAPGRRGEDDAVDGASAYASSKLAAETLVRRYSAVHAAPALVARVANVYGGRVEPETVVGAALAQARDAELRFRDLAPVRDFLHVRDAAEALVRLAPVATSGCPIVNVGTGVGSSVAALAEEVAAWRGRTGPRPRIAGGTTADRATDTLVLDIGRLRALTGWAPAITLRDGLADALERICGAPASMAP
jgi:UDP-glucose 4-epimerase